MGALSTRCSAATPRSWVQIQANLGLASSIIDACGHAGGVGGGGGVLVLDLTCHAL
jgi:hypothetical protein